MFTLRRSARLAGGRATPLSSKRNLSPADPSWPPSKRAKRSASSETTCTVAPEDEGKTKLTCLGRSLELNLQSKGFLVMGVDEAGRGPLAGPVVAAAAMVPTNIDGIVDSKKITKEEERERLYEAIVTSPDVKWAVAVIDAARIDEINILQATLEGMHRAVQGVLSPPKDVVSEATIEQKGCYVVCSAQTKPERLSKKPKWFALVDGNRLPKEMPCDSDFVVKGDSKEYAIAAASILAKVTRDRLMRQYDALYPVYNLAQHKGYPTAAHMALVQQHGASPIHRRSFAPLRHMTFDENGRVVRE